MKRLIAAAVLAMTAGCASQPVTFRAASMHPSVSRQSAYWIGRRDELTALRHDPAFHVTEDQLKPCPNKVSPLPHDGKKKIPQDVWWTSRQVNLDLMYDCRKTNADKIGVIYQMLDRLRNPN